VDWLKQFIIPTTKTTTKREFLTPAASNATKKSSVGSNLNCTEKNPI